MRTLILLNIISSNTVYRLNTYTNKYKENLGEVLVFFCGETEKNRKWSLNEKINFKYKILPNKKLEIGGKDLLTYFVNYSTWSELNKFNPDRVIISGWSQSAYHIAFLWAFINKKKITLWSGSTINEKSIGRILIWPIVRLIVRISDDFIAYGKRAKDYLISLGASPKNIEIFLNDVNKDYFIREAKKWRKKRIQTKKLLGIKTKFNFLYVGQLIERKGVLNLIKAFECFKKDNLDWGLVFVGYGNEEGGLKKFVQIKKIKDIYLLGNIEQYNLPRIYTSCECLVLPSLEEVWGLVVNEALHCGLKVIVSNKCGCVPDLVINEKNGYVFSDKYKGGLLKQMKKLRSKLLQNKFV